MIKIKNSMHSNLFFGMALFLGFLLMWGCSKNVAPPDVEAPLAPVVEQIPDPEPEETLPELVQEEGFGILEDDSGIQEGGFVDVEPEPIEEIAEVIPEPEPVQEFIPEPEPEFVTEPVEEVMEEPQVMQMQDEVFVAPAAETEPVQEARVLPFEDEKQLQDIHFEYDRDNLDSQTKTILRSNSEWLQQNPNARVEIQGHADERGSNNYNLGLGERRALQTKKYLISLGVDESRLYTISYGEEKPFCFQSNENCWWENRRAHFTVAD
ncbi:MAG: OmpA family protein [Nitrospinae bacterium]|nr:OmpA family protein [Nitrospinota bacterium]